MKFVRCSFGYLAGFSLEQHFSVGSVLVSGLGFRLVRGSTAFADRSVASCKESKAPGVCSKQGGRIQ